MKPAIPIPLARLAVMAAWTSLGLLLGNCSRDDVAGTGTETSTQGIVVGRIVHEDGRPAAATVVEIRPSDFNPVADKARDPTLRDTTDKDGYYAFRLKEPGGYCLQALQLERRTRLFIPGIEAQTDSLHLDPATLTAPGSIRLDFADSPPQANGYVYIPGTSQTSPVEAGDASALLDSIPAGLMPSLVFMPSGGGAGRVLRHQVPVASGRSAPVRKTAWPYAKYLTLNTGSSGVHITENLLGFPLLLRLNSPDFPFAQAKANGEDIRFAKIDGTPLAHETEAWDPVSGSATLWIRMDTVLGDSRDQGLVLYWGNAEAANASNGALVFDTGAVAGFQGVWHMHQSGMPKVMDATANQYHGLPTGLPASSGVEGVMGRALAFDGFSSAITLDLPDTTLNRLNFSETSDFTVAAWIYPDSNLSESGTVWDKGYKEPTEYYLRVANNRSFNFTLTQPTGYEQRTSPAALGKWTHVVAVKKGNQQYLYIDGVCADSAGAFLSGNLATTRGGTWTLGRSAITSKLFNYFHGLIDDITIADRARSADWIRLSHESQKKGGALLFATPLR